MYRSVSATIANPFLIKAQQGTRRDRQRSRQLTEGRQSDRVVPLAGQSAENNTCTAFLAMQRILSRGSTAFRSRWTPKQKPTAVIPYNTSAVALKAGSSSGAAADGQSDTGGGGQKDGGGVVPGRSANVSEAELEKFRHLEK